MKSFASKEKENDPNLGSRLGLLNQGQGGSTEARKQLSQDNTQG